MIEFNYNKRILMDNKAKKIKISFSLDKRIFCLYCALVSCNIHEKFKKNLSKSNFYKELQSHFQHLKLSSRKKLELFFNRNHYFQYLCWVLRHSDFPEFKLRTRNKDSLQKPDSWFDGFDEVLRRFYKEAEIKKLWERSKPKYQKIIFLYQEETEKKILEVIRRVREKKIKLYFNEIVLIPNLLEAIGVGFAPMIPPRAYIIFGPSTKKVNTSLIIHEFLHHLINPLLEEKEIKKKLIIFRKKYFSFTTPLSRKFYPKWSWIASEYFVRAFQATLIQNKIEREKFLKMEEKQGFPKIKWFFYCFQKFKHRDSMRKQIIEILDELSKSKNLGLTED